MDHKQMLYDKKGPQVAEALRKRLFEAYYCPDRAEALALLPKLVPAGASVGWGGTQTVNALGVKQALLQQGCRLIDRDSSDDPQQRMELMRQCLLGDFFLMSANAISEDGQLVNIDGYGNRVAALAFGPRQVLVFAGMNKVAHTLTDAIARARTIAAPINMQRFPERKTPCAARGECFDCKETDSICSQIVVTRLCRPAGRIKVILIGEDLGF